MGELVFKDASVKIGTTAAPVDLSDHVRSVTISYSAEILDKTAMGSSGRRRIAGLKDFNVSVEFNQDFAANKVDATLFGYIGSTAKWITIKKESSAAGAVNPRFHGDVLLESYPIGGDVGSLMVSSVTFQGDGLLTRSTTAT